MAPLGDLFRDYTLLFWVIGISLVLVVVLGVVSSLRRVRESLFFGINGFLTALFGFVMVWAPLFSETPVFTKWPYLAMCGVVMMFLGGITFAAWRTIKKSPRG
jgi:drug/metabolite transporter (DMT)-like permease